MQELRDKYIQAIGSAADEAALEELRVQAVGKKGEISLKMRELGKMTPEERQTAGPALNALKDEINSALAAKKTALADAALDERLQAEWLDVTLPGRDRRVGSIHRSPRSGRNAPRSSPTWALPWPRGRRSRTTGTISTR
jgi:phenylalanyl-tRNA synthetase alpha chain